MDINLRNAVVENISNNSEDELRSTIVDAIQSGEEQMLPGLGVLFEIIWQNSSNDNQANLVQTLSSSLQN